METEAFRGKTRPGINKAADFTHIDIIKLLKKVKNYFYIFHEQHLAK
jgi:hypothetical protein